MDTATPAKIRIALKRLDPKRWEYQVIDYLLSTVESVLRLRATPPVPSNYELVQLQPDAGPGYPPELELADGTREYCIGYAEGYEFMADGYVDLEVRCGGFVVWPEEKWGELRGEEGHELPEMPELPTEEGS